MLTIYTGKESRSCEGLNRRNFIQAGALGLGGLTLSTLLETQANAGTLGNPIKDKTVVVLFLSGGATHVETFDPKMSAPVEYRSMTGEVATSLPGVTIGGGFPQLAKLAHRMAFVRSFRHGNSSHGRARTLVLSGGNKLQASWGSMYARIAGTSNPRTGLPNYTLITPKGADSKKFRQRDSIGTAGQSGTLGSAFRPFDPSAGGEVKQNMIMNIPRGRLTDRRALLANFDRLNKMSDASQSLKGANKFQQQAFDVILGGGANAFDLSEEDPKVIRRYSTERYRDKNAQALGHQMLMARRLCESGVGFVNVSSGGWDMHRNLVKDMNQRGNAVDHAVAAFLSDIEDRGLSEKVLLIITGEFGRTPRINKRGGRDHWGNLCTLALAGGGLKMGQVIGRSDRKVSVPATKPVTPLDLTATVVNTLIDIPTARLVPNLPLELTQFMSQGQPISQLM